MSCPRLPSPSLSCPGKPASGQAIFGSAHEDVSFCRFLGLGLTLPKWPHMQEHWHCTALQWKQLAAPVLGRCQRFSYWRTTAGSIVILVVRRQTARNSHSLQPAQTTGTEPRRGQIYPHRVFWLLTRHLGDSTGYLDKTRTAQPCRFCCRRKQRQGHLGAGRETKKKEEGLRCDATRACTPK